MYWSLGGSVSGGGLQQTAGGDKVKGQEEEDAAASVSYTHLTLPTIYSV